MGLRAMPVRSASAVLHRHRATTSPHPSPSSLASSGFNRSGNSQLKSLSRSTSLPIGILSDDESSGVGDLSDDESSDFGGLSDYESSGLGDLSGYESSGIGDFTDDELNGIGGLSDDESSGYSDSDDSTMAPTQVATVQVATPAGTPRSKATVASRAAKLSASAAARLTRLVGENPPMGSSARVVRRQYQSVVKEREKDYNPDDKELIDAIALYDVEFPKQPLYTGSGVSATKANDDNYPLGIDLETDFYGKHTVVKDVKRGSVAYALFKSGTQVLQPGHIIIAVNGKDISQLSFLHVLAEIKIASAPRVLRFLNPNVLPIQEYQFEPVLLNRDQYGFAKNDRYILNYRRQLRKRKLTSYEHERRWAKFVQRRGGTDEIDRLLHDESADPYTRLLRGNTLADLRSLVLQGIPAVLRPRVWGILTGVTPYRSNFAVDYYPELVAQIDSSASIGDIDKDIHRTYPEHAFFQSDQGRRELKNVLGAYSLHNPGIGYCQSMNFIAGMMVLFTNEEDAFWLFCAIMERRYLPAENYTQSMVGTQTDQLVFKELVAQELPVLAERLDHCGIQIQLITLHWFLCAFVCTLPTESALRVWDWFFMDGQEVLFITAIGILKQAESRIMAATTHSDLHIIVRELGTDLHNDDAFMAFLYTIAPPAELFRRQQEGVKDLGTKTFSSDDDDGSDSSSCSSEDSSSEEGSNPREPVGEVEIDQHQGTQHPPTTWAATKASTAKPRRRKRALHDVPTKLHTMLQHFMESQRRGSSTRQRGAPTYQKQFTLAGIEELRERFRPQFEKKPQA